MICFLYHFCPICIMQCLIAQYKPVIVFQKCQVMLNFNDNAKLDWITMPNVYGLNKSIHDMYL